MAKAKKAVKKTAAKKAVKKANGTARGNFRDKVITVVASENPHRDGTNAHAQFKKYSKGLTVAKALEKGLSRPYIYHDMWKGYIKLSAA